MRVPSRRAGGVRLLVLAVLVAAWDVGVRAGAIDPFYTSAPLPVLATAVRWVTSGYIVGHALATLGVTLVGLASGMLLGVLVGFAVAFSRRVERVALPFLAAANALPRVILYPLFVLWLGVGPLSRVVLVISLVAFPAIFNTQAAIRSVDREVVRNARVLGAGGPQLVRHIYLPAVAVWLLSTIRVTMGFALAGAILGEYVGAVRGMGMVLAFAQAMFNAREVMAGTAVLLTLIWIVDFGLRAVERTVTRWRMMEVV